MPGTKFTHLKKDEREIAERFELGRYLDGEYVYDVHLDVPIPPVPAWWTKTMRERYANLRAKRIDLVIKRPNEHWIIEITPKLSKAPLGGVLAYRELYKKQYKPGVPVKVGVVVEMDDPAYHDVYKMYGVEWWVV